MLHQPSLLNCEATPTASMCLGCVTVAIGVLSSAFTRTLHSAVCACVLCPAMPTTAPWPHMHAPPLAVQVLGPGPQPRLQARSAQGRPVADEVCVRELAECALSCQCLVLPAVCFHTTYHHMPVGAVG